jgi:hypothetical protein
MVCALQEFSTPEEGWGPYEKMQRLLDIKVRGNW